MTLILASTSPYRASLLKKTGIPFETMKPAVDEDVLKQQLLEKGISPSELAKKLSYEKGQSVFKSLNKPDAVVVSGDQLAELNGEILGKPGSFEKARQQLKKLSSHTHRLLTAVTITAHTGSETFLEVTEMTMRALSDGEIERYLELDTPYDCAGSYKIEENGIPLFSSITGEDFTSIQGIPMIWLCNKLKEYNCEFFRT
jgi:septum formation protein